MGQSKDSFRIYLRPARRGDFHSIWENPAATLLVHCFMALIFWVASRALYVPSPRLCFWHYDTPVTPLEGFACMCVFFGLGPVHSFIVLHMIDTPDTPLEGCTCF
jgi:hypothetical protein